LGIKDTASTKFMQSAVAVFEERLYSGIDNHYEKIESEKKHDDTEGNIPTGHYFLMWTLITLVDMTNRSSITPEKSDGAKGEIPTG
jgi:hypothetical protein